MLDVSARLVELALRQFQLGSLRVSQLTDGLALGARAPSSNFVHWNELALLFARAEEAVGGPNKLAELSSGVAVEALPEGRALMAIAADVTAGAQLINQLADATFFANLRYPPMKRTGARTLTLTLRVPQRRGYMDSPAYFRAMEGTLRTSSAFAGLSLSTVKAEIRPFVANYDITLPRSAAVAQAAPEQAVKAAFARHCQQMLESVRQGMLELRATELRALESEAFVTLSAAVTRALAAREGMALPIAAARAIQDALNCRRVAILRAGRATQNRLLPVASVGRAVRRVYAIEAATTDGFLRVEADVQRASFEARALERLAPWLAIVCAGPPETANPSLSTSSSWAEQRLLELAARWSLTPRQQQVAWLMVRGESNKSISAALRCSEGTVELHAHAVRQKSGIAGRAALAAYFFNGN